MTLYINVNLTIAIHQRGLHLSRPTPFLYYKVNILGDQLRDFHAAASWSGR